MIKTLLCVNRLISQKSKIVFLPETNDSVFVTSVKLLELLLLQDQHLKIEEESSWEEYGSSPGPIKGCYWTRITHS